MAKPTQEEVEAVHEFLQGTLTGDDKGLSVINGGQLSVGTPENPTEFVCGGGDSYPVPYVWHVDYANISGLTVTSATDVSTILQSDNGSTTGLFDGTASGKCILVMSENRYGGVKIKMDTAGTVEADNVTAEYLQDNSPTWVTSPYMVTDADFPYSQLGNVLGGCSSCSEQWRFGFDPDNIPPQWDDVTLNINGTDYTGKWAIFRTTGAITLDPVLEQIKMHTNRAEVNSSGTTEYFGRSRYPGTLSIETYQNADKGAQNQNISIGTGVTLTEINNKFPDNSESGRVIQGRIPVGLDTSIPVEVDIEWYPDVATAGNVELEAELIKVRNGFAFDGTETPTALTPVVTAINNQQYERQISSFKFFVNDLLPGDQWYVAISRDSTVTNTDDTLAGAVVVTYTNAVGYFWRP